MAPWEDDADGMLGVGLGNISLEIGKRARGRISRRVERGTDGILVDAGGAIGSKGVCWFWMVGTLGFGMRRSGGGLLGQFPQLHCRPSNENR